MNQGRAAYTQFVQQQRDNTIGAEEKGRLKLDFLFIAMSAWMAGNEMNMCVKLFKSIFDRDNFYLDLNVEETEHHPMVTADFYYMMAIVDVFVYKSFHRVSRIVEILSEYWHPMNDYLRVIILMLDPDRETQIEGLELFKHEIKQFCGIVFILKCRRDFCKQLKKVLHGMSNDYFDVQRFCTKHDVIEETYDRKEACYDCLADFEVVQYNNARQFRKQTSRRGILIR